MFRRPTPSVGRARLGATLNFFTNGLILSLLPRLPEIKQTFALGDGAYGLMVAALGMSVSLMVRGDIQRTRLRYEPALSLVPEALAPPNGC